MKALTEQQVTDVMILYKAFDLTKGVQEIAKCAKAISLSIDVTFADASVILNYIVETEIKIKGLLLNN